MLEELFYIHRKIVEDVPVAFKRYLYDEIDWGAKHICITGCRGTGKTTLLLQHYLKTYNDVEKCMYISADHVVVAGSGLFNIAREYFKLGGEAIIIDEIHKSPNWEAELKSIIDTFKHKRILVSGSSATKLKKGKADLSRRVVYYHLKDLSFREYLMLAESVALPVLSLDDVITDHVQHAELITKGRPILKYFNSYLNAGAYPFITEGRGTYLSKLLNVIEKVLYEDVAVAADMKQANIPVLKKILWLIASSVPFQVNIEKMSRELGISKQYVYQYIDHLDAAGLINAVPHEGTGYKTVRKPAKILMANSNLLFAANSSMLVEAERGCVRETFFVSQLATRLKTTIAAKGDFNVADQYIFEIGGPGKGYEQIKDIPNAFVAADGIEVGFAKKIPLYLFGLLY
jgi:predicted AAA+ superfamily ATPase